jgi:5-hydroxyisourate hydrolase-like protein (transthyretin family)
MVTPILGLEFSMKIWIGILVAMFVGQSTTPQAPPSIVEGLVVRFSSSDPIPAATVELRKATSTPVPPGITVVQVPPGGLPPGIQLPAGVQLASPIVSLTATTNAEGRFQIQNVQPGEYRVYATRETGYVPGEYGQRSPTGEGLPLVVESGQRYSGLRLSLTPVGSITGRVTNVSGEPAEQIRMGLVREAYRDGVRSWTFAQTSLTDDRGEYRFYSVPPGKYYVSAAYWDNRSTRVPQTSEPSVYPNRFAGQQTYSTPMLIHRALESGEVVEEVFNPVYYPGTAEIARAKAISLRIAENVEGIDFNIATGTTVARKVRGVILNSATGTAAAGALVNLIPREPPGQTLTIPAATAGADGTFEVVGVLPIAYSVLVTATAAPAGVPTPGLNNAAVPGQSLNAYAVLDAGKSDVNTVRLVAAPGVDLPWRASFDEGIDDAAISRLRITLVRDPDIIGPRPVGGVMSAGWTGLPNGFFTPPSQTLPAGGFVLRGVAFGDYRVSVAGLPPGAYLQAIRFGNRDVLRDGLSIVANMDNALEITLGKTGGQLEGRVLNRAREPERNVPVVLVPANRARKDLYQKKSTDLNGRFKFDGIMPGSYKVFAWEDVVAGAWQDPEFLRAYETRGATVDIATGNPARAEVEIIPWSDTQ